MLTFEGLDLIPVLVRAVNELGFKTPTPIQEKAIPYILKNNNDVVAFAQTGTGKTAAYCLPLLQKIDAEAEDIQVLILTPTRELCLQVTQDIKNFTKYLKEVEVFPIYGGNDNIAFQMKVLEEDVVHIVVGTPGRVKDLVNRGKMDLSYLSNIVLDEADEMLSMGLQRDVEHIINQTPVDAQSLLFSATRQEKVEMLMARYLKNPYEIQVGAQNISAENIKHFFYSIADNKKYLAIKRIIGIAPDIYGIIFCRTKKETQDIANRLIKDNFPVDVIHGDMAQEQRERAMMRFRKNLVPILVATDVAARGIDLENLTHVINYNLPQNTEAYIHRSGRTGRAGNNGIVISFVTIKEEEFLDQIEETVGIEIEQRRMPSSEAVLKKQFHSATKKMTSVEIDTTKVAHLLPSVYKKLNQLSRRDLINRFLFLEVSKYKIFDNITETMDASPKKEKNKPVTEFSTNGTYMRFYINLGSKHKLNPLRLIKLVNEAVESRNITLGKIEILPESTFFELDRKYKDPLLNGIKDMRFNNLAIMLEAATETS